MFKNFIRVCDVAMNIEFTKFNWKLFSKRGNLKNVNNDIKVGFPLKNVVSFNVIFQFLLTPFLKFRNPAQMLNIVATLITMGTLGYWAYVMYGIQYALLLIGAMGLLGSRWIFAKDGYMIATSMMWFSFLFVIASYQCLLFTTVPILIGLLILTGMLIFKKIIWNVIYMIAFNSNKLALMAGGIGFITALIVAFGFSFIPIYALMGILATITILTYSGSIHHVMSLAFIMAVSQLFGGDYSLAVHEGVSMVLGMGLPVILIELYYWILKLRGYPNKTFVQCATYFNQWNAGQLEKAVSHHNIKPIDFITLLVSMEGIVPMGLLLVGILSIFSNTSMTWGAILTVGMFFSGIIAWLFDYSGRSTKYFYNNVFFCIPFFIATALYQMPLPYAIGLMVLSAIMLVEEKQYLFEKSSFSKGIEWLLEHDAKRVIGCNYYALVNIFGRDNVRYAANSAKELKALIKEGYQYLHVDTNTDALIFPEQLELLNKIEKYNEPVFRISDDLFESIPLKWMYLGESAKTEQISRGFKALADERRRETVIYDLQNIKLR